MPHVDRHAKAKKTARSKDERGKKKKRK
jgi:hypothetical protein